MILTRTRTPAPAFMNGGGRAVWLFPAVLLLGAGAATFSPLTLGGLTGLLTAVGIGWAFVSLLRWRAGLAAAAARTAGTAAAGRDGGTFPLRPGTRARQQPEGTVLRTGDGGAFPRRVGSLSE